MDQELKDKDETCRKTKTNKDGVRRQKWTKPEMANKDRVGRLRQRKTEQDDKRGAGWKTMTDKDGAGRQ